MENLSSSQIEARLADLEQRRAAHEARDFDAEVAQAVRAGRDLDAIETEQSEVEVAARKVRIEIAALKTKLPEVRQAEGNARLAEIAKAHTALIEEAIPLSVDMEKAWNALKLASDKWTRLELEADRLTHEAAQIATKSGATMPALGRIKSRRVVALMGEWNMNERSILASFASADHSTQSSHGLQHQQID